MANKFEARWGKEVQASGYVMAPFLAMQIGDEATRLAVITCCYWYTWEGPTFKLNVADMAARFGVTQQCLQQQIVALWERGLIEITSKSGHGTEIDMSALVSAVNALAIGQQPLLAPRVYRPKPRERKQPQLFEQTTPVVASEATQTTTVVLQTTPVVLQAPVVSIGSNEDQEKREEEKHTPAHEHELITPKEAKRYNLPIGEEPSGAVKIYLKAANDAQQPQTPCPEVRSEIDAIVTDLEKWQEHLRTWLMKGYRFANVADLLDTYKNGFKNGNGNGGNGHGAANPAQRRTQQTGDQLKDFYARDRAAIHARWDAAMAAGGHKDEYGNVFDAAGNPVA